MSELHRCFKPEVVAFERALGTRDATLSAICNVSQPALATDAIGAGLLPALATL